MRESQIEKYLVQQVKELGGEVRKVNWIGRNGAPDRLVMLTNNTIWVELKAPKGRCAPHQIREHDRMKRMGQTIKVINSIEAVDALMASLHQPPKKRNKIWCGQYV